jgi:putative addiction module component (TIGR02574 family)
MASVVLSNLLRLPPQERAELAIALWESLTDAERETELTLSPEQEAELDRRWAEHLADPSSAVPWEEVRKKLLGRE